MNEQMEKVEKNFKKTRGRKRNDVSFWMVKLNGQEGDATRAEIGYSERLKSKEKKK